MRYTTLLIDIDETILDFYAAERAALECAFKTRSLPYSDKVFKKYHKINDDLWKAYERGEIAKDVIRPRRFEELYAALGLDGDPEILANEYVNQLSRQGQLIDGATDFLTEVRKKFSVYAVTNGIGTVQQGRFDKADLWKYFDDVFISEQVGFGKPDKRYFDYVLSKVTEKDKSKILVIGDSPTSDIKGAQNVGLDSLLFRRRAADYPPYAPPTFIAESYSEIISIIEK